MWISANKIPLLNFHATWGKTCDANCRLFMPSELSSWCVSVSSYSVNSRRTLWILKCRMQNTVFSLRGCDGAREYGHRPHYCVLQTGATFANLIYRRRSVQQAYLGPMSTSKWNSSAATMGLRTYHRESYKLRYTEHFRSPLCNCTLHVLYWPSFNTFGIALEWAIFMG